MREVDGVVGEIGGEDRRGGGEMGEEVKRHDDVECEVLHQHTPDYEAVLFSCRIMHRVGTDSRRRNLTA